MMHVKHLLLGLLLFISGCRGWNSEHPPIHPNINLDFQASIRAQESPMPVPEHTLQFGSSMHDAPIQTFTVNESFIKNGQKNYNIYCAACHTRTGNGTKSIMSQNGWVVSNLLESVTINRTDNELYDIIKNGIRSMPGYKTKLSSKEIWEVVTYVRALQKIETATDSEINQAKKWSHNGSN